MLREDVPNALLERLAVESLPQHHRVGHGLQIRHQRFSYYFEGLLSEFRLIESLKIYLNK